MSNTCENSTTKGLTLIEKLEVAKALKMDSRIVVTPDEAENFISVFKLFNADSIAAMKADKKAKEDRVERITYRMLWVSSIWFAGCSAWAFVDTAMQVFWGQ